MSLKVRHTDIGQKYLETSNLPFIFQIKLQFFNNKKLSWRQLIFLFSIFSIYLLNFLVCICITFLHVICRVISMDHYHLQAFGRFQWGISFSEVHVTQSLVLCVCFVDCCLSFCTFSFGHFVVCSSSIYGFWLPLWYLQTKTVQTFVMWLFYLLSMHH